MYCFCDHSMLFYNLPHSNFYEDDMQREITLEDYNIVKTSNRHHETKQQYCLKIVLSNGEVITQRLKGCYPTRRDMVIRDESQEYQNKIHVAAAKALHVILSSGPRLPKECKYKSAAAAMKAFRAECGRDYHGNSFCEYFGERSLLEVPGGVSGFVDWLLEKYNRCEGSVCKKVFAASALFQYLIRTHQWVSSNPFRGILQGIRFAEKRRLKSMIEPAEHERLQEIMRDDRYKELRIITTIMFFTGTRPSEAMNVEAANIDTEILTLLYRRTKRKNKPADWRRIPIPAQLVAFLVNEGRMEGKVVRVGKAGLEEQMRKVANAAQVGGLSMKTWRKDFACRARLAGVSRDDVNLWQGRDESLLEHYYTTDEWFIVHLCRPFVDRMFAERPVLALVKT